MYDSQTAKFIATIVQNLPKMSTDLMQGWIENPKNLQKVLKNILCPPETIPDFKVWKTINLGTPGLKTADDFRKELKTNGFKIGDWANDILGNPAFTVAAEEVEFDIVVVTVKELGFKTGATQKDIYNRAKELGLDLCPAEVGPQLRLQYKDQPNGEWIFVAMEPIAVSDGNLQMFNLFHTEDGLWLSGNGYPGYFWNSHNRWLFSRRK